MKSMHTILAAATLLGALVLAPHAHAADACKVEISGNDAMQFDKQSLAVPATCKDITVTLHHTGKLAKDVMGHDWVLVSTPDLAGVANDGISAGIAANYIKAGDKRVLAHTNIIGGGETTSVTFPASVLKAGGSYSYLCTFPGHSALMHGTFKIG
jgi:azurin